MIFFFEKMFGFVDILHINKQKDKFRYIQTYYQKKLKKKLE
jgi:hypothetical protein